MTRARNGKPGADGGEVVLITGVGVHRIEQVAPAALQTPGPDPARDRGAVLAEDVVQVPGGDVVRRRDACRTEIRGRQVVLDETANPPHQRAMRVAGTSLDADVEDQGVRSARVVDRDISRPQNDPAWPLVTSSGTKEAETTSRKSPKSRVTEVVMLPDLVRRSELVVRLVRWPVTSYLRWRPCGFAVARALHLRWCRPR